MLAVDSHRNASQPCCGDRFECPKIARVHDVRPKLPHDANKTEQWKLHAWFRAADRSDLPFDLHTPRKLQVNATHSANAVFKIIVAQTTDNFEDAVLSASKTKEANYVQYA